MTQPLPAAPALTQVSNEVFNEVKAAFNTKIARRPKLTRTLDPSRPSPFAD